MDDNTLISRITLVGVMIICLGVIIAARIVHHWERRNGRIPPDCT